MGAGRHNLDCDWVQIMTDESTTKDPNTEDADTFDDGVERDFFLQTLVEIVNRTDIEMDVTLTIGGALVSGMMISGKSYYERLSSLVSKSIDNKDAIAFFKKILEEHEAIYDGATEETPLFNVAYIHLKNVKFTGTDGNSIPDNDGTLWRGRISQVSGFNLGTFKSV
jgi:hypothetical protein